MKKFSLCAFLCLFIGNIIADQLIYENKQFFKYKFTGKHEKMSQSFIFPRPVYTLIEARQFLTHEFFADPNCGGGVFQAFAAYQHARPSHKVGEYFAINFKNNLTVLGDDVDINPIDPTTRLPVPRDVRAEWLGLDSNFNGEMRLSPAQTQWAAYLEYYQSFKAFTDNWFLSTFYLSAALPIQHVKNDMNFEQFIAVPSTRPGPTDLFEAFNRPELKKARIPIEPHHKTAIAELILRLGSYFMHGEDGFELGLYSMGVIPLADHAKAKHLFSPMIGHNGHWGGGTGVNFQMPLNCSTDERIFAWYVDLEHIFLFRATQKRTLDLRLKPWSRYLLLNSVHGQCNIPAANVLTRKVRVESYSIFDGSTGFRFYNDFWAFEFGYSAWAHGFEWLRLKEPWLEEFGIAGQVVPGEPQLFVNCVPVCPTASKSTISCQAANDVNDQGELQFVPIKWSDLNFYSGAARAAVVNRFHVAVGFKVDDRRFAFFAGLGAFGEFPRLNTAFGQYGVWAKIGGSF